MQFGRFFAGFITLSVALAAGGRAQTADFVYDPARVSQDIRVLSSDAFEGRAPGTPGEVKSVDYIIRQMKASGLRPGGAVRRGVRGWTQDVPMRKVEFAAAPVASIAAGATTRTLVQGQDIAIRAPLDGSDRVSVANVPLVFAGYGVSASERQWDDFKNVDLHGKILVVLVNDPDFEAQPDDDASGRFGGREMTYYGRWTYKFQEAARRGALGCLIIHEDAPASYGWSVVKTSDTGTMYDIVRPRPGEAHPKIEGWLPRDGAVALFKASGLDFEQMKKAARSRNFQPVTLTPTFSASYAVTKSMIVSHNVLGRRRGLTRPGETVFVTAHWDHLGIGKPDSRGDTIYNGARDNASGVAMMLELARSFAKAPPVSRSVVFMAVTGEERGLLGSEYYAANPIYPLATTVADINMDGAISGGLARDFTLLGNPKTDLLDLFTADAAKLGRRYSPGTHPEAGTFFRGDSFSFAKRGVPAVSFFPGRDLVDGGLVRGNALFDAYNHDRYHQPSDEWAADWDLSSVIPDQSLLHAVLKDLADGKRWPEWSHDSEFKTVRDASKADRHE